MPQRFTYALEAIVPVSGPREPREMELLCRTAQPNWVEWYHHVPQIVLNAVQNMGVKRVSVNLDTQQILNRDIASSINILGRLPVDIEWTERVSSEKDTEKAGRLLCQWRDRYGLGISIDDVGSGQDGFLRANLTQARRIKIAGQAFQSWRAKPRSGQLVSGLVGMYRAVDCEVVVEWVETLEDVAHAHYMRATHTQGRLWRHYDITGIL